MARINVTTPFWPWKDASRSIAGNDLSVLCRLKCIADQNAAGAQADQATVTVAANVVTIQIAGGGGALANDAGINYTGQAGAAGTITITDGNANSIIEAINILNGVGVGQAAFRRYRAALGDVRPGYVLTGGDVLAQAAANILLGRTHAGFELFLDTSGLTDGDATEGLWVGIGTDGGTIEGARGWRIPDYFEDIPGASTTGSVNTPERSSARVPRKAADAVTRQYQYRITGFSMAAINNATQTFRVYDIDDNIIWEEAMASAVTVFQDRSDTPIVGPVGSPLFCHLTGTGGQAANTSGLMQIQAEGRAV